MTKEPSQIQKETKELYEDKEWKTDQMLLLLAMQEELGELTGAYLQSKDGYKKIERDGVSIKEEVGDLGNLLLAFCNAQNLDFDECVQSTIKKCRNRQEK